MQSKSVILILLVVGGIFLFQGNKVDPLVSDGLTGEAINSVRTCYYARDKYTCSVKITYEHYYWWANSRGLDPNDPVQGVPCNLAVQGVENCARAYCKSKEKECKTACELVSGRERKQCSPTFRCEYRGCDTEEDAMGCGKSCNLVSSCSCTTSAFASE